ncbi:hypothetical protein M2262_002036 [Pseudomonas sp. BIGb0408]|uniref:HAMP domain-containing protein n=1 Tax=Phytopseudomonas flavescens TaxID=29435 RepID=A0A7Y9XL78_9GAMM|nr:MULTISPECIES: cache domain-containing protein [Pseudomonas]MCW2291986.1 hypothetical protein [Pseudomonas sp. BIGb0408]NYH73443.1 hypothetical protein [Pseudomonas flavescens]
MPGSFRPAERRLPLHVHISVLFMLMLLLAGGALGLFNYRQTTAIIFSSSATLFEHIQQDVHRDISATYQPIRHLLGVLAYAQGARSDDLQTRMTLLAPFAQALRDNPKLASLYLGYRSGDFFMVRALRTRAIQRQFQAPDGASLQIWSVEQHDAGRIGEYLFFDDALNLLERRTLGSQDYDPRMREWYSRARSQKGSVTTTPYVFFSSGAIGTTLANAAGEEAVIAADLTLEDLSATLIKHKVTPNSEVVLFDARGLAVAYPDSQRLLNHTPEPRLRPVTELLPELAGTLDELAPGHNQQGIETLNKRRWVVSRSHVSEGGPDGLYLALLVPEDELLADAYRIRWQGALITLTTLLLCLPIAWLVSRCITRPLAALQDQTEAMGRFDFAAAGGIRSSVLEVDCLAQAMARMNRALIHYQQIIAELGHQPSVQALLKWITRQTLQAIDAQAGIVYLVEDGRLRAQTLELEHSGDRLRVSDLQTQPLDGGDSPVWLAQALDQGTAALSLGFDKAGDLQPLLNALGTPRVNVLAIALRDRQGKLLGLFVLLQGELLDGHRGIRHEQCVAFSEAVAAITARHLESRQAEEPESGAG